MVFFRSFLVLAILAISSYTAIVVANHGVGLIPIFFGDMKNMTWPGQFNLDFLCFLLLSGLWMAWRNEFSPLGIGLGIFAVFAGFPFLAVYLLIQSFNAEGDLKIVILGAGRASA